MAKDTVLRQLKCRYHMLSSFDILRDRRVDINNFAKRGHKPLGDKTRSQ